MGIREKAADLPAFASSLLRTTPVEGGRRVPLVFNEVQAKLHENLQEETRRFGVVRALIPKARQMGVSTYTGARFYHRAITRRGTSAIIVAHRADASAKLFAAARALHEDVPPNIRSSTSASNAHELVFDRMGSRIRVATAEGGEIGRSDTFQLMHLSEAAFFKNAEDLASGLLRTVHDVAGTEVIIESTGNGQSGLFYAMCKQAALEQNEGPWRVHFLPWTLRPQYRSPSNRFAVDWKPPPEFAAYGRLHVLDPAQVHWFWTQNHAIATMNGGSPNEIHRLTRQEYPATFEECFLADSTFDFFAPSKVNDAMARETRYLPGSIRILAVDPSINGNDPCFVCDREGETLGRRVWGRLATADQNVQADWLVDKATLLGCEAIVVDATGLGIGLVSALRLRLRSKPIQVVPIVFSAGASKPLDYGNRRAEIYDRLRMWIDTGALPNDNDLAVELAQYKWGVGGGCRRDENGRLFMTPKEKIREEIGRSPDRADCAALAMAI